ALELPAWLNISSLDDLKNKLTSVIVVVLGVVFLGKIVSWDGSSDILNIGASIALVIAALTWFLRNSSTKGN
ncbi:MAG: YqhA family protein, partial [Roseiflexaceae bacterium]